MASQIDTLFVENFQSHQRTKLTLAPAGQLTVITGPSDSGKTALIRALRWILLNVPQGSDFIRAGTTQAVVSITLPDGTMVVRERGRSYNRYRIVNPSQDDLVLEGFGCDVPVEVQDLTGVRPVEIGDLVLNLNLSEQLDGPFLGKSISAGARAKVLGKLAGTEEVDLAQKTLGTDMYRANQEEKRLQTDLEDLDARIAGYAWLPWLEARVRELEEILTGLRAAEERRSNLATLQARLAAVRTRMADARAVVERWATLDLAENEAQGIADGLERAKHFGRLKARLIEVQSVMKTTRIALARWVLVDEAADVVNTASGSIERVMELKTLDFRLARVRSDRKVALVAVERWTNVDEASALATSASEAVSKGAALMSLRRRHLGNQERILVAKGVLAQWAGLDEAMGIAEASGAAVSRLEAAQALVRRLMSNRDARVVAENRVRKLAGMVKDAESRYMDELIKAGRCPTCGSTVDPIRLKEAV